jgi:hypothetical protein
VSTKASTVDNKKNFDVEPLNVCLKWFYIQMEIFPYECVLIFYLYVITQRIIRVMKDNIETKVRL